MRQAQKTLQTKQVFNESLKTAQRSRVAPLKHSKFHKALYDLPLMHMIKRLGGIRKDFKKVAFCGPNPYLFIQHMPQNFSQIEKLYVVDSCEPSLERSFEMIQQSIDSGFYESQSSFIPDQIIPFVKDSEKEAMGWDFEDDSLDLIVTNCDLHWSNSLEEQLKIFKNSLEPDGVLIGSLFGGDTLQELRISFNLAEMERDGGVSPVVNPFMSLTELGNLYSRCGYTMPTCDLTHAVVELPDAYQLFTMLQETGEQNCMHERRAVKSNELFVAVAALYQTLFNMQTSPPNLSTSVHVDNLVVDSKKGSNIVATFDYVNLIGWKYKEGQQQAKERGSAEFSLKDVVKDMNEESEAKGDKDSHIKYGVIIDDGDTIREE